MRALRYHGVRDLRLDEDIPEPQCKDDEIKIKPAYVGICGSDLHEYSKPSFIPLHDPHPLSGEKVPVGFGHEFSGTVVEIGSKAKHDHLQVGDKVAVFPLYSCKSCHSCEEGLANSCSQFGCYGVTGKGGGLADFICAEDQNVYKLSKDISLEIGALVEPLAVAWHAVNRVPIEKGDNVLVLGAGLIGLGIIQCLKVKGANVIVSEVAQQRQSFAKEFGAAHVLNPKTDDVVKTAKELCGGVGPKVAFDCAGVPSSISTAVLSVRPRGAVINVAIWENEIPFNPNLFVMGEKSYHAILGYFPEDFRSIIEALEKKILQPDKMITSKIRVDRLVEDGFTPLVEEKDKHVKILVDLTQSH